MSMMMLVHKFSCSLQKKTLPTSGTMYVTNECIYFDASDDVIWWKSVSKVENSSFLLYKSALLVVEHDSNGKSVEWLFHSFDSCSNAIALLNHICAIGPHTPSYELYYNAETLMHKATSLGRSDGTVDLSTEDREDRMIRKALYAMNRGQIALESLARQDEMINRSEAQLEAMEYNLSVSDRVLRGMSSFSGSLYNLATASTTNEVPETKVIRKKRNIPYSYKDSFPVVYVNTKKRYRNVLLSFAEKRLYIVDSEDRSVIASLLFENIDRVSHLSSQYHLTVSSKGKKGSTTTIEFISIFAPLIIRQIHSKSNTRVSQPSTETNDTLKQLFTKIENKRPIDIDRPVIFDNMSEEQIRKILRKEEIKQKRKTRDKKIDQLHDVLGNMRTLSFDLNGALTESNTKLAELGNNVDKQDQHIKKNTEKINRKLYY